MRQVFINLLALAVNRGNTNKNKWPKWPIIQCQFPDIRHDDFSSCSTVTRYPLNNRQYPPWKSRFRSRAVKSENDCNKNSRVCTHTVFHFTCTSSAYFFIFYLFGFYEPPNRFRFTAFPPPLPPPPSFHFIPYCIHSNRFVFLVFSSSRSSFCPSSTRSTSRSGCHKWWQVESAPQQQQPSRRPYAPVSTGITKRQRKDGVCVRVSGVCARYSRRYSCAWTVYCLSGYTTTDGAERLFLSQVCWQRGEKQNRRTGEWIVGNETPCVMGSHWNCKLPYCISLLLFHSPATEKTKKKKTKKSPLWLTFSF